MSKIKDFWTKLKSIKHFEIWVAVVIGLLVCVIYFSFFSQPKNDSFENDATKEYSSAEEYVDYLENKLCNVLSKISGVGDCSVIITLESGFSYEYATETDTKTTVSGGTETTITTETVILVSNEPVIIKENYPVIKGVVIVAKGAENFSIKMDILEAVETVLEVDSDNITILS